MGDLQRRLHRHLGERPCLGYDLRRGLLHRAWSWDVVEPNKVVTAILMLFQRTARHRLPRCVLALVLRAFRYAWPTEAHLPEQYSLCRLACGGFPGRIEYLLFCPSVVAA